MILPLEAALELLCFCLAIAAAVMAPFVFAPGRTITRVRLTKTIFVLVCLVAYFVSRENRRDQRTPGCQVRHHSWEVRH